MPAFQTQGQGGALQNSTLQAINLMTTLMVPTQGNIWFVAPRTGSDVNNSGTNPGSAFKTLGQALTMATANQNDIVYLLGQGNTASLTTDYQDSNLNWNKNSVHLIGVNSGPMIGQRSRIAPRPTTTSFANLFTVSGNGCLIKNIEFFQGTGSTNPTAASTCVTVDGASSGGQRNVFQNCQISGVGDDNLDDLGSNDLTISGSENFFQHCYIGLDTITRDTVVAGTILSGTNTRNTFEDCHFEAYTTTTSYKFVTVGTSTDRFVKFKNCEFNAVSHATSAAAPTGAIGITTMNGHVIIMNCGFFNCTQVVTADNAYVIQLGLDGTATGHLIGIGQTIDAA